MAIINESGLYSLILTNRKPDGARVRTSTMPPTGSTAAPTSTRTISRQLRAMIQARGRSAAELGRAAGVDRSVLNRFLADERDITLDTVDRLADVLGLRLIEGAVGKVKPAQAARPPRTRRSAPRPDRPGDGQCPPGRGGARRTRGVGPRSTGRPGGSAPDPARSVGRGAGDEGARSVVPAGGGHDHPTPPDLEP